MFEHLLETIILSFEFELLFLLVLLTKDRKDKWIFRTPVEKNQGRS